MDGKNGKANGTENKSMTDDEWSRRAFKGGTLKENMG